MAAGVCVCVRVCVCVCVCVVCVCVCERERCMFYGMCGWEYNALSVIMK